MKLHEIAMRDPTHERETAEQTALIAAWIESKYPGVEVIRQQDQYGRHVVFVRSEHDVAHEIRHAVGRLFPSLVRTHAPAAAITTLAPVGAVQVVGRRSRAIVAAPALPNLAPGFHVVFVDAPKAWQGHVHTAAHQKNITSARRLVRGSKTAKHAVVVEVKKQGGPARAIETWTKARTLWHRN